MWAIFPFADIIYIPYEMYFLRHFVRIDFICGVCVSLVLCAVHGNDGVFVPSKHDIDKFLFISICSWKQMPPQLFCWCSKFGFCVISLLFFFLYRQTEFELFGWKHRSPWNASNDRNQMKINFRNHILWNTSHLLLHFIHSISVRLAQSMNFEVHLDVFQRTILRAEALKWEYMHCFHIFNPFKYSLKPLKFMSF